MSAYMKYNTPGISYHVASLVTACGSEYDDKKVVSVY